MVCRCLNGRHGYRSSSTVLEGLAGCRLDTLDLTERTVISDGDFGLFFFLLCLELIYGLLLLVKRGFGLYGYKLCLDVFCILLTDITCKDEITYLYRNIVQLQNGKHKFLGKNQEL